MLLYYMLMKLGEEKKPNAHCNNNNTNNSSINSETDRQIGNVEDGTKDKESEQKM